MITKFYIFENLNLDDVKINVTNSDQSTLDSLIEKLSLIIQKRIKRNLRIIDINGNMNQLKFQGNIKKYETNLILNLSNKDKLEIDYFYYEPIGKEKYGHIKIKINDTLVYDIDSKEFLQDKWIDKLVDVYKKYLENNNWKIS